MQILDLISHEPQTLISLIHHTHSTSAKVSWICQNLRGKGMIDMDQEGVFYLSETVNPETSGPTRDP